MAEEEPTISVKLSRIYDIMIELQPLIQRFDRHEEQATVKESEQDARLANHGTRLGLVEERLTRIETERATEAKLAGEERSDKRAKRPNWAAIVSSCVAGFLLLRDYLAEFTR